MQSVAHLSTARQRAVSAFVCVVDSRDSPLSLGLVIPCPSNCTKTHHHDHMLRQHGMNIVADSTNLESGRWCVSAHRATDLFHGTLVEQEAALDGRRIFVAPFYPWPAS
jgi:hypothetical protein